ncbi:MAG: HAD hydrolase family protein [Rhodospirillales bacterium]|nr:HAD hydrolase family protein [Rhodospirillales bacterium]
MSTHAGKKPEQHIERLSKIKLLSLDVDGVLTDGGIYYTDSGDSFRKFNAKDGMGIVHLQAVGIPVCLISMGLPGAIDFRAKRLGIKHVYTDVADKAGTMREIAAELGISLADIAHMGDDINDLKLFDLVGLRISVADGMDEVKQAADIISTKVGGAGAVREITDIIRKAQGSNVSTAIPTFN